MIGDFYYTPLVKVEKYRSPPNPVFDLRIQKSEEKYENKCIKKFFTNIEPKIKLNIKGVNVAVSFAKENNVNFQIFEK